MEGQNDDENSPLIDEFNINVAGVQAFNQCITLGNVLADNRNRLICVDTSNHLKVFDGEILQTESKLNITPVGIVSYFSKDKITQQKTPFIAVAGGIYIYIYKNLKGSLKIPMPNQNTNSVEVFIYDKLAKGEISSSDCLILLERLAEKISKVKRNIDNEVEEDDNNNERFLIDVFDKLKNKLNFDDNNEEQSLEKVMENKFESLSGLTLEMFTKKNDREKIDFLEKNCNKCIKIYNYITLITKIFEQEGFGEEAESYLIVGTENSMIMIIDPKENKIINRAKLAGVPFLISCYGSYKSENRIIIGDRGCNIYIMKKSSIMNIIVVPQPLVSLLISSKKTIYLGTTGRNYIALNSDGSRKFSLSQPNTITCMELAERLVKDEILTLIATKDKDLRIYKDDKLCIKLNFGDTIFGMKFGKYDEQNENIIMFTYGGALFVKSFNEKIQISKLEYKDSSTEEVEKAQLDIPKKTYLYQDLVQREKEMNNEMHTKFITDIIKIKHKAMGTYVKMLQTGNAPQNYSSSSTMKLSASLEGLGPNFRLNIVFSNVGNSPIYGAILTLDYNRKIFRFEKESILLSLIMPNVPVNYSLQFRNVSENGSSGNVKVIVIDKNRATPLIQTTIRVPISELDIF